MTSDPVAAGATVVGSSNATAGSHPAAEVDIESLAAAVRACPAVDDLAGGRLASVATYRPGRQVAGLRVEPDRVTVQVRAVWNSPVTEVARQLRAALAPLVGARTIDIELADVADPAQAVTTAAQAPPASGAELSPTTAMPPRLPAGGSVETWTPSMPGAEPSGESSSGPSIPTVAETRTNS